MAAIIGNSSGMDLLVVVEDARETESFATGRADILFLLCVDASVITQCHGIGKRLGTEGAGEIASLVCVLMVQQTACMTVASTTNVTLKGPFLFYHRRISVAVMVSVCRLRARFFATDVTCELLSSGKYQATILAC